MRRLARSAGAGCLACSLVLAAGCTDPKDAQIADLKQRNVQLQGELETAQFSRDSALHDAESARQQMLGLEQQLADAQAAAAARPESGGWESVPGGARIAIAGDLLFGSGQAVLRKDAQRRLEKVASDIRERYASKDIFVFGHTDSEPIRKSPWKDNFELSCERALAVVRYLESKGIPGERLVACGRGEHNPQAPNTTADARAKNRRVEIFAIEESMKGMLPASP